LARHESYVTKKAALDQEDGRWRLPLAGSSTSRRIIDLAEKIARASTKGCNRWNLWNSRFRTSPSWPYSFSWPPHGFYRVSNPGHSV